jgi:hypothetical protein
VLLSSFCQSASGGTTFQADITNSGGATVSLTAVVEAGATPQSTTFDAPAGSSFMRTFATDDTVSSTITISITGGEQIGTYDTKPCTTLPPLDPDIALCVAVRCVGLAAEYRIVIVNGSDTAEAFWLAAENEGGQSGGVPVTVQSGATLDSGWTDTVGAITIGVYRWAAIPGAAVEVKNVPECATIGSGAGLRASGSGTNVLAALAAVLLTVGALLRRIGLRHA